LPPAYHHQLGANIWEAARADAAAGTAAFRHATIALPIRASAARTERVEQAGLARGEDGSRPSGIRLRTRQLVVAGRLLERLRGAPDHKGTSIVILLRAPVRLPCASKTSVIEVVERARSTIQPGRMRSETLNWPGGGSAPPHRLSVDSAPSTAVAEDLIAGIAPRGTQADRSGSDEFSPRSVVAPGGCDDSRRRL
jgi:hypothetical protein